MASVGKSLNPSPALTDWNVVMVCFCAAIPALLVISEMNGVQGAAIWPRDPGVVMPKCSHA